MLKAEPWAGELAFTVITSSHKDTMPCPNALHQAKPPPDLLQRSYKKCWLLPDGDEIVRPDCEYTLKLEKIRSDPTTSCLMFSTKVSCFLIAWGNYPPWYNPGLLESSLSQTAGTLRNTAQGYCHFGTAIQFSLGNALTSDQSSNWSWGVLICLLPVTLVRPHQPQKEATCWGMYSQTVIFI